MPTAEERGLVTILNNMGASREALQLGLEALRAGVSTGDIIRAYGSQGKSGIRQLIFRDRRQDGDLRFANIFEANDEGAPASHQRREYAPPAVVQVDNGQNMALIKHLYEQLQQLRSQQQVNMGMAPAMWAMQQQAAQAGVPNVRDNAIDIPRSPQMVALGSPAGAGATTADSGVLGFPLYRTTLFAESGGVLGSLSGLVIDGQPQALGPGANVPIPGDLLDAGTFHQEGIWAGELRQRVTATGTATAAGTWTVYARAIPSVMPRATSIQNCCDGGLQWNGPAGRVPVAQNWGSIQNHPDFFGWMQRAARELPQAPMMMG